VIPIPTSANTSACKKLIAKRSHRDLGYNRQFALGGKSKHIAGSDRRVINDDTCRLYPRLGSLGYYIVKRSCRHLCDGRDIVKKSDQSNAQRIYSLASNTDFVIWYIQHLAASLAVHGVGIVSQQRALWTSEAHLVGDENSARQPEK
jgi:hypothetical protein